jgi:hypothetical protein
MIAIQRTMKKRKKQIWYREQRLKKSTQLPIR